MDNKKFHICIVCPRMCHGGAERVAASLANGFIASGHKVSLIYGMEQGVSFHLSEQIKQKELFGSHKYRLTKWIDGIFRLRKNIKSERPDVVIGVLPLCSFLARIASIGLNIPVIATEHNSFERPASAPMSMGEKWAKFYLNKIYKWLTVITEADKKVIGDRLNNVIAMPNPLFLSPINENMPKEKIVLAAGRIDNWHYKGFDNLLKAWSIVMQDQSLKKAWRLQIAGAYRSVQNKEYLEKIAKDGRCADSVEFLGFQEGMQSLYQRSEIFVLSSRYEGFGLVALEAMSQGCAVIACDYKGRQREFIHSGEGALCNPEDVEELAETLKWIMIDEEERRRLQQNAVIRSKEYALPKVIERWERLITTVLESR